MIVKNESIETWHWYKIIMDNKAEYIVRITDYPLKYSVIEYYDGRIMTTGSLAKCKKWIKDRRINPCQWSLV